MGHGQLYSIEFKGDKVEVPADTALAAYYIELEFAVGTGAAH
jgi:hypothetical protein